MSRHLAHMPTGPVNPFQQWFQAGAKNLVIVGTPQAPLGAKFHVPNAAHGAGQTGPLLSELADMLAYQTFDDRREVQLFLLNELLLLRTCPTQVKLFLTAVDNIRQMDSRRIGTTLALHLGHFIPPSSVKDGQSRNPT